jgi:hypothetical protein
MNDAMQFIRTKVSNWIKNPAVHYFQLEIPDSTADADGLKLNDGYFQVFVSECFLKYKKEWFNDLFPAAHTALRYSVANRPNVDLSHVSRSSSDDLSAAIIHNTKVTNLVPWRGGTLEIDCSLISLRGKNELKSAFQLLGSFSELVAAPVAQALNVAGKVATGVQDLMISNNGDVHLNYSNSFTSAQGKNPLRPGHFLSILATQADLKGYKFSVEKDHLLANGKDFTAFDYLLFRLDYYRQNPEWNSFVEIDRAMTSAMNAYADGTPEGLQKGDEHRIAARIAANNSDDLSPLDKIRVVKSIDGYLEQYRQAAYGGAAPAVSDMNLDQLMKSEYALKWEDAVALSTSNS